MADGSEAYDVDAFPNADFPARELPRPSFSRTQDVRGLVKHVRTVAWSCDGKRAATGGEYKEIQVWDESLDSKTTTPLPSASKPSPHNHHVSSIAWSPVDPNVLISADKTFSMGSVIAVWDVTSPSAPIATFKTPGDVINLAWHPSGRHFAAVYPVKSRDLVDFFRLSSSAESEELKWEKREDITLGGLSHGIGSEEINSLRFINSGQLVCAVSNDGSISAWVYPLESVRLDVIEQMEPEQEQGQEQEDADAVTGGKEDEDDKYDLEDGPVTPDLPAVEPTAEEPVEDVKPAESNGDVEMTETENTDAKQNEESKEEEAPETNKPESQDVEMADVAQSNTQPSSAQPSRQPTPPPPPKTTPKPHAEPLRRYRHNVCYAASLLSLAYDPKGRYFVVGGQDALLSLFDTKEWICERSFDVCSAAIRHTAFSYDGEFVAIGGDDLFIAIVSVYTGQTVAKIPIPAAVNALSWNPKKNSLAYCHQGKGGVPLWHVVHQE
ncbi:hypothetical protein I311_05765 [Cryptococcus gattii NT-10]|nr:hypothetical protein I311_05765 [Cryptococcus gattii NT-10]